MPVPVHEALGVTSAELARKGVFDGFLDLDSPFYLDPRLVVASSTPEFAGALDRFDRHFEDVMRLLAVCQVEGDKPWRDAVARLRFREVTSTGLGYGKSSTRGAAIGNGMATRIAATAREIVQAGISDPAVFELLSLFEEGIGADRVSDITVSLILPSILAYTERIARELGAPLTDVAFNGATGRAPYYGTEDRWFLLLPEELLTDLPVAYDFDDVGRVCAHNDELRDFVNRRLGGEWRERLKGMSKRQVRDLLLEDPKVLRAVIAEYRRAKVRAYDFRDDPAFELRWFEEGGGAAASHPLQFGLDPGQPLDIDAVDAVVEQVVAAYKHLIENCGLWELLWDGSQPRPERAAQRLFYGTAWHYCRAANIDLTPEPNAGSGPVDFKASQGARAKVLVELKRSGNSKLMHGFESQLERYRDAEMTDRAFFVVLDFGDKNAATIESIARSARDRRAAGEPTSRVVVIDTTRRKSASRAP